MSSYSKSANILGVYIESAILWLCWTWFVPQLQSLSCILLFNILSIAGLLYYLCDHYTFMWYEIQEVCQCAVSIY